MLKVPKPAAPTPAEQLRRKRFLSATLITCISLVVIGGSLHVVRLGSMRMGEMRALATYDLKEESSRIRAQGEDIVLHEENEQRKNRTAGYTVAEAEALLTKEQWQKLNRMVEIPAGSFQMGSDLKNADAASHPQHAVKLKAYLMDKYLITKCAIRSIYRRDRASSASGVEKRENRSGGFAVPCYLGELVRCCRVCKMGGQAFA